MKILLDMNLSPKWKDVLSCAGFEAVHWSSIGRMDAPDTEIMGWAREHEYILFLRTILILGMFWLLQTQMRRV